MLWAVSKMGYMVIGVDFLAVIIPPAPIPMVPHPYFDPIFLWMTPKFGKVDTLINGVPANIAGAIGYCVHVAQGAVAAGVATGIERLERQGGSHPYSGAG